jgi:hypothetical protein
MKTKFILVSLILLMITYHSGLSQDKTYKSTVSLGVGQSMVKALADVFLNNNSFDSTGLKYTSLPAFYGNYDYQINEFFSVGAAGSFQLFKLKNTVTSEFVQINRTNIGIRALFHYGNTDKMDMYSGVRLSTTMWDLSTNITGDPSVTEFVDDLNASRFFDKAIVIAPQIVAFGIKGYFTDMFGAHMEFSIGSPYYLSGGVNVRF